MVALAPCPACGSTMSVQAASCPGCGQPTRNAPKGVNAFGVGAFVFGILALLICWLPLLNLLALPLAAIGFILAVVGVATAFSSGRTGTGWPIAGGVMCLGAAGATVAVTGFLFAAAASASRSLAASASHPRPRPAPVPPPAPDAFKIGMAADPIPPDPPLLAPIPPPSPAESAAPPPADPVPPPSSSPAPSPPPVIVRGPDAPTRFKMARALEKAGKRGEAIRYYRDLVATFPFAPESVSASGRLWEAEADAAGSTAPPPHKLDGRWFESPGVEWLVVQRGSLFTASTSYALPDAFEVRARITGRVLPDGTIEAMMLHTRSPVGWKRVQRRRGSVALDGRSIHGRAQWDGDGHDFTWSRAD